MERLFTPADQWYGGYYQLDVDLGSDDFRRLSDEHALALDARMRVLLEAVWAHPALEGPYRDRNREPSTQSCTELTDGSYGVATLPDGARVPCSTFVYGRSFSFEIPMRALERAWPQLASYPWGDADDDGAWQDPLDEWFADIGRAIFERIPFSAAVIGFEAEVPNDAVLRELIDTGKRTMALLIAENDSLSWYPATVRWRTGIDWNEPTSAREHIAAFRIVWTHRLRKLAWSRRKKRPATSDQRSPANRNQTTTAV